jgi:exocyst complex protein 7
MSTLRDAQRGYADMRGTWSRKWLEPGGKRVLDRADTIDTISSGKEFGTWVEALLNVSEVSIFIPLPFIPR